MSDMCPQCFNLNSQLIASKGYPVEEHNVTTRDSYVLMMQRIPAGRAERSVQLHQKPAVILMSGLQGSSADYVVNMPDQSLGFMLADNGYDVWLANVRGTRYSSHLHLKKSSSGFWDFSLDEMISYDLPDQIDTVLNVTQQEALFYVGWSQGTAIMFGLLSSKPEYNQKPWPPAYNLRNVTTRVALYWGDGDVLATPRDVRDLYKKLPNVVLNYKVPVSGFTHLDFGWSIKAKDHLYKKMLGMMSAYSRTRQQVSSPKEVPEFL
ncbi:gastric triacylglycerol lipase-like [Dermacentor silvarum]|uniref:gastric triacylglycerol lipase-like n=1 Tax=Dermacentor silvarum TaxID=543639 RepID=UPI002100F5B8|nr:gastric triacylglycerol lipase-like [Dermacentor silvarum]